MYTEKNTVSASINRIMKYKVNVRVAFFTRILTVRCHSYLQIYELKVNSRYLSKFKCPTYAFLLSEYGDFNIIFQVYVPWVMSNPLASLPSQPISWL